MAEYQRQYAVDNAERINEHKAKWWNDPANREQTKLRAREARRATKLEVFSHYGGSVCGCCGEIEIDLLSLDHKFNDGNLHRKGMGGYTGEKAYRWARKNNWPAIFQVLCLSCNIGKHLNGGVECPHETTRRKLLAA